MKFKCFLWVFLLCLGLHHQEAVAWKTGESLEGKNNTHLWIVNQAVDILRKNGRKHEANMMKKWESQWMQGLYDADHLEPYCSKIPPGWKPSANLPEMALKLGVKNGCTYVSHFYDPEIDGNWLSPESKSLAKRYFSGLTDPLYKENARTRAVEYFHKAGQSFESGEQDRAFYYLGLSLHYMTDSAMPFHAANFTFFDSTPFGYHSLVETYAANIQKNFKTDKGIFGVANNPGDWIAVTAKDAKSRSEGLLSEVFSEEDSSRLMGKQLYEPLGKSLMQAQGYTAGYIELWFKTIKIPNRE